MKYKRLLVLCIFSCFLFCPISHLNSEGIYDVPTAEAGYPPIPYLGSKFGAIEILQENGNQIIVELFKPNSSKWIVKAPRGAIGELFAKQQMYAWTYVPLLIINLKFESSVYLYTRDISFDYYVIEQK